MSLLNSVRGMFPRRAIHQDKSRSRSLQSRARWPLLLERLEDRTVPAQLLGSLALGNQPLGEIAVNPNTDRVYVAGGFGQSPLLVVNASVPANPTLVTSIGTSGSGVTVDPTTNRFYSGNLFGGQVIVYDGPNNAQIAAVTIGGLPGYLDIDSGKKLIYVGSQGGGGNDPLGVINGANNTVVAGGLGSGGVMSQVHVNPATGNIYVNRSGGTRVFSPSYTMITDLSGGMLAANPSTNRLYFGAGSDLQVRDGTSNAILATIAGAGGTGSVAVNTNRNRIYVADSTHGLVKVIDGATNTVVESFSLGANITPDEVAVDSAKNRLYVAGNSPSGSTLFVYQDTLSTTVNFDALNAAGGPVTGAALHNYLLGFGITITNASSNTTPSVVQQGTTGHNGNLGYASSPPNFFITQQTDNNPYSFRVNFATPLSSFSFTRAAENGNGPSGLIVATWDARAMDSTGGTLSTVGEGQLAFYTTNPAAPFTLNGPGIAAVVFERTSFNSVAGLNAVPTDDWVLTRSTTNLLDVTNTNDSGAGSLRQAILTANASPGHPTITFHISSGVQTIYPLSGLPTITHEVTVDATTQPGYAGKPLIVVNGRNAGNLVDGLTIVAGNSTLKGLVIDAFVGSGIVLKTNGNNLIVGDYIGTDVTGKLAVGNGNDGVLITGSSSNVVGGTGTAPVNVISGNRRDGVELLNQSGANIVQGNYIGTDVTGTVALGNSVSGVEDETGPNNRILANIISANGSSGVVIENSGANGNLVQGNKIGTDITGSRALGNGIDGIFIQDGASNNLIGGTTLDARNIISGNVGRGVEIDLPQTNGNQVQGNYIGTDIMGQHALGNMDYGVILGNTVGNMVGGAAAGAGNVISSNKFNGIYIGDGNSNVVQGNFIGTNRDGSAALGNDLGGVAIINSPNNTVGGTTAAARNVISGNNQSGVVLQGSGATGIVVQGNYIGTDASGTAKVPNAITGIIITNGAHGNTIGGMMPGAGNLVSGNAQDGIAIFGSGTSGNAVQGNFIGTNAAGTAALPNGFSGVAISGSASNNLIGGREWIVSPMMSTPGNIISGNLGSGVAIFGSGTSGNTVQDNLIGTDATGTVALGNGFEGVRIFGGASNNMIGGAMVIAPGGRDHPGNIISGNKTQGVTIYDNGTTGNSVQGNYIGTNLTGDAPLANAYDGVAIDSGANGNTIGGTTPGAGNVISGNARIGINLGPNGPATSNLIQRNFIGTDITGTKALKNSAHGVYVNTGSNNNTIGGTTSSAGNLIAFNGGPQTFGGGIYNNATLTVSNCTISGNSAPDGFGGGIYNDGTLTISNSTLSANGALRGGGIYNEGAGGGTVTLLNSTLSDNSSHLNGGGIENSGTLTVTNSTLSNNNCDPGGGISSGFGGGIANFGTLIISYSTLSSNNSARGGGIFNTGTGTVTNSALSGNTSRLNGGGIENSGTLAIGNSTLSNNTSDRGGGIANFNILTINNSTLSNNNSARGGSIFNTGTGTVTNSTLSGNASRLNGGSIENSGTLAIGNSTLSNNTSDRGGGIANFNILTINNSTLSRNGAPSGGGAIFNTGTFKGRNTIIAGNTAPTGPDLSGSITSLGHNLIGNTNGASGFVASDLLNVNPLLGPLQDNGGPTQTMALLPGSPALDAGDNTGAPDFDQRGPGFPRIVGGTIDIGAFEVQPGAVTQLMVTAPSSVTAGSPFDVTVTALDAYRHRTSGYTGTIHFSSSDPAASLPSDYTFTAADNGVRTFTATLFRAGSQTLTARDTAINSISGSISVTVNPAAASTLVFDGFFPPIFAGVTSTFSVTAKDPYGNIATGYRGTIHFTSSDPQAVLPANYTFTAPDAGSQTFGATLKTAGSQSFSAIDTVTSTITGSKSPIIVNAAAASTFTLSGFPSPSTAGVPGTVMVTAKDLYGNTVIWYAGTVHFTSSDAQASLPAEYTFTSADAGIHSFSATLKTAGSHSLTVTDITNPIFTVTLQIFVNAAAASTLAVAFYPPINQTAGEGNSITIVAVDPYFNIATGYRGTVSFSSTDRQATFTEPYTFTAADNGIRSLFNVVTFETAGLQSVTATDTSNSSIMGTSQTIRVFPAAANHLVISGYPFSTTAGSPVPFTVTALDPFGNPTSNFGEAAVPTVIFSSSDRQAVLPSPYTFTGNASQSFVVVFKTAGPQSLTVNDMLYFLMPGRLDIVVNPAAADHFQVAAPTSVASGVAFAITVAAKDPYGNTDMNYTGIVTFTTTDADAGVVLPPDYTFQPGDGGVATFSGGVMLITPGVQTVTATDTFSGITGGAVITIVSPSPPGPGNGSPGQGIGVATRAADPARLLADSGPTPQRRLRRSAPAQVLVEASVSSGFVPRSAFTSREITAIFLAIPDGADDPREWPARFDPVLIELLAESLWA